jgi:hypothetical protein
MVTQFFIDRQFGAPIYLRVDNGIFVGCLSDSSFEKNIEKFYSGKPISFVAEEFKKKMKGVVFILKHGEITNLLQKRHAIEQRMTAIRNRAAEREGDFKLTPEEKDTLAKEKQYLEDCNYQIEREKKILAEVHGFEFN